MSGTNLIATQVAMAGLSSLSSATTAGSAAWTPLTLATTDSPSLYEPSGSSNRYILAGAAFTTLGTVLAGCAEPRPAPIPNESSLPANQSNCTPTSSSPYCTSQREVLNEMVRMREEGHHSDQSLFVILGAVALVGTVSAFFLGRRRGRKGAERLAQQQTQVPQEPPAAQANGTPKADNK